MRSLVPTNQKVLIGVVHLRQLPGSPRWGGDLNAVIDFAVADARAYGRGGAHAILIENFGDVQFTKAGVGPETIAMMSAVSCAIRAAVQLPIGFNVLRNDACAALALCAACDGAFIRVKAHTGALLPDQGLIEGDAVNPTPDCRSAHPNPSARPRCPGRKGRGGSLSRLTSFPKS
jgi:uncharacterized protein